MMTQGDNFVLIASFLFLWTGSEFDLFQLSGKIPEFKELRILLRMVLYIYLGQLHNIIAQSNVKYE